MTHFADIAILRHSFLVHLNRTIMFFFFFLLLLLLLLLHFAHWSWHTFLSRAVFIQMHWNVRHKKKKTKYISSRHLQTESDTIRAEFSASAITSPHAASARMYCIQYILISISVWSSTSGSFFLFFYYPEIQNKILQARKMASHLLFYHFVGTERPIDKQQQQQQHTREEKKRTKTELFKIMHIAPSICMQCHPRPLRLLWPVGCET